jgi:hypothetical protein
MRFAVDVFDVEVWSGFADFSIRHRYDAAQNEPR